MRDFGVYSIPSTTSDVTLLYPDRSVGWGCMVLLILILEFGDRLLRRECECGRTAYYWRAHCGHHDVSARVLPIQMGTTSNSMEDETLRWFLLGISRKCLDCGEQSSSSSRTLSARMRGGS